MTPGLHTLPPEVIEAVGACLETSEDWAGLRLTCREIQFATRRHWAKEFFSYLGCKLGKKELSILLAVSQLPDLAKYVCKIRFQCQDDQQLIAREQPRTAASPSLPSVSSVLQSTALLVVAFQNFHNIQELNFSNIEDASPRLHRYERKLSSHSITFSAVMFAADAAGVRPRSINLYPLNSLRDRAGLLSCDSLPQMKDCFSEVIFFSAYVLPNPAEIELDVDSISTGRALGQGLSFMRNLRTLWLALDLTLEGQRAFGAIANSTQLPCLESVSLVRVMCSTLDLKTFLHNHASTVRMLVLSLCMFPDADPIDDGLSFRTLPKEIRDNLQQLQHFWLDSPFSPAGGITFPGLDAVTLCKEPNEDDYVEISLILGARLDSREEIVNSLPAMIFSALLFEPFD